ncbi:MAG: NAD-dependent epimerase/dehydratase family protein [Gemmatimonadetes bacterium]|jgi:hypothetical protein|nr:NAD-dependent epimerase/dehydratase family protein [Gemmatimonadota bacterium]MBT6143798.1 NAD-dependent epimerase/dehydratase family protein [Gemmatimonadota bacterium]MBT7861047.1 NAD-dependent epimerase/dehydratase family protein [Gemmatimonadota bacterium]
MSRSKLVVTGATGTIATRILPDLAERYDLILLDVKSTDRQGNTIEGVIEADLLSRDRDGYRHHFEGADAVLHCAFIQDGDFDYYDPDRFWMENDNVRMAYNIFQVCQEADVRRVVMMSSNHAADYYEHLIWGDKMEFVTPEMIPLTDNFYGWAKVSYESLGFVYACGGVGGRKLENVHLRIGGPRETDIDRCDGDLKKMHRALGAYLSVRDEVQLVVKSIEEKSIEDANGIPHQVFYGISNNTHRFWSIQNARDVIGYAPEDDSAVRFADKISAIVVAAREQGAT